MIIPETETRFVEAWVDGNDLPLIKAAPEKDGQVSPGSPVRLTFEGWPAIQTAGWPQLAINTSAARSSSSIPPTAATAASASSSGPSMTSSTGTTARAPSSWLA